MKQQNQNLIRIPVFFAVDENYFEYLTVAITSILESKNENDYYDFFVLSDDFDKEKISKLKKLENGYVTVNFIDVAEKLKGINAKLVETLRDYYTVSIFYRIFIPSLFPSLKKAIYLDSDIIVKGNLRELFDVDLKENLLGVVADESVKNCPEFRRYVEAVLGVKYDNYFNSGVLLMNLEGLRKEKIEEKVVEIVKTYNFSTVAPDQDYLNYLCKDKVLYLKGTWNKMPINNDVSESEINIIHYNMCDKPWHYDGILYENYFWKTAYLTEYYQDLLDKKEKYTEYQKRNDCISKVRLISKTIEIVNSSNTFKRVLG